jgi:hypothetical protein
MQPPAKAQTISLNYARLPIISELYDGAEPSLGSSTRIDRVFTSYDEVEIKFKLNFKSLIIIPLILISLTQVWFSNPNIWMPITNSLIVLMGAWFALVNINIYLATRSQTPSWFSLEQLCSLPTYIGFTKDAHSSELPHHVYKLTSYKWQRRVYRKVESYVPVCELLVSEIMSQATLFDNLESLRAFVDTRIAAVGCRVKNVNVPTSVVIDGINRPLDSTVLQSTKIIVTALLSLSFLRNTEQGFCGGSLA